MPPAGIKFRKFRWTFGCKTPNGYKQIKFNNKNHKVHQIVCRAFNGLPPESKPFVDHINRNKADNRSLNLRYVDRKENAANQDCVDRSVEKYGVRACDDKKAWSEVYMKVYTAAHREEHNAWQRTYDAAKRAKMKAQGLSFKKGPNGKMGWYPRVHKRKVV